jgi:hypothetical protein
VRASLAIIQVQFQNYLLQIELFDHGDFPSASRWRVSHSFQSLTIAALPRRIFFPDRNNNEHVELKRLPGFQQFQAKFRAFAWNSEARRHFLGLSWGYPPNVRKLR